MNDAEKLAAIRNVLIHVHPLLMSALEAIERIAAILDVPQFGMSDWEQAFPEVPA